MINKSIKCCAAHANQIDVYVPMSDSIQHTYMYGRPGSKVAGELNYPLISDDDDEDGSLLIADSRNNRIQVMTSHGEYTVLKLDPPVTVPRSAVLFNNHLYVMSMNNDTLVKYGV